MIYFDYLVTIIHVVTFDESSSLDIVQDFMFIGASYCILDVRDSSTYINLDTGRGWICSSLLLAIVPGGLKT
jgi:hypothetical protein